MEKQIDKIKETLQKCADKIKKEYPDVELLFYVDDNTSVATISIFKGFLGFMVCSQKMQALVMQQLIEENKKNILTEKDKAFIFKYK